MKKFNVCARDPLWWCRYGSVFVCVCVRGVVQAWKCVCGVYVFECACVRVCVVCMCLSVCVCMYVCVWCGVVWCREVCVCCVQGCEQGVVDAL